MQHCQVMNLIFLKELCGEKDSLKISRSYLTYSTQFHIILSETEQSVIENIVRTPFATNKCTA